ncbi:hypothetical protein DPMN_164824 [Dreissena polymorpha]|uniref:Uncharacterized protein n=1 Tax=Dreissena polymorpha TaxID=45954 RepID=A0A9D4EUA9_DREPO|nr:hypothetical protein DPMN_164824 [Dreissena polymorpha]
MLKVMMMLMITKMEKRGYDDVNFFYDDDAAASYDDDDNYDAIAAAADDDDDDDDDGDDDDDDNDDGLPPNIAEKVEFINYIDYEVEIDNVARQSIWEQPIHYGKPEKSHNKYQRSFMGNNKAAAQAEDNDMPYGGQETHECICREDGENLGTAGDTPRTWKKLVNGLFQTGPLAKMKGITNTNVLDQTVCVIHRAGQGCDQKELNCSDKLNFQDMAPDTKVPDGRTDSRTDGRTTPKQYPSASGGG